MSKDQLQIIFAYVGFCIVLVLFFAELPNIINYFQPQKQLTYEEWYVENKEMLAKGQAKRIYMFTIMQNSDKGGLRIGYNGCIYYHRKFIGCDKTIAKSLYETFGKYYFPKK